MTTNRAANSYPLVALPMIIQGERMIIFTIELSGIVWPEREPLGRSPYLFALPLSYSLALACLAVKPAGSVSHWGSKLAE